jgi:sigma-B regulation protein RsbU (phosphoserine phosphatase)
MSEVNRRLCHDTLNSEFLTAYYGVLSPDGRRLRYCNAGHEPLILMREGKIRTLDVGGLVLGIDPSARYEWAEHLIKPNDLLVLITDGIIEALDFDDRAYGRDRLHDSILRHGADALGHSPDFIAKQLLWDVRRFTGLAKLADDITLVVTRVS